MSAPASSGPPPEARLLETGFDQPWRVWQWGRPEVDRPIVLALHGFTGSGLDWELPVATFGSAVGAWMAPDLPGHGGSVGFTDPHAYTLDGIREGLRQLIAHLPARPTLMGYSMGGRLAWHYALQHSDTLEKLILIGANPGMMDPAAREERLAEDALRAQQLENSSLEVFLQEWESLPVLRSQECIPDPWKQRMRQRRRTQNPRELAQSLRLAGTGTQQPRPESWSKLTCPVHWVVGAQDNKFKEIASQMVNTQPGFQLSIIPEVGHTAHLENSLVFYKNVWPNVP